MISAGLRTQCRIEIEFLEGMASIFDHPSRQDLEAFQQSLGFRSPMGFDHPDQDIGALARQLLGCRQHGVGLADAGCRTKKHLELTPSLSDGGIEQGIRIRTVVCSF